MEWNKEKYGTAVNGLSQRVMFGENEAYIPKGEKKRKKKKKRYLNLNLLEYTKS